MSDSLDESSRQRTLDLYRIVDSLPEAAYADIVSLASILCDTPMALISLIDRERQWFKASTGVDGTQTRRDEAFCNHAIGEPSVLMEVPDATRDPRFVANPLVTGQMGIRFYAGMPLVADGGAAIGTVCVLDKKPRELDARQRSGLEALTRLTMTLIDARRHEQELERKVLLHDVAQHETAVPAAAGYAVAIFQIQELAAHAARLGERTLERQLHELEQRLVAVLPAGDSINRTSHSADFIAVLHGDAAATEQRLRATFEEYAARGGIVTLCGSACAQHANERIEQVYLRADDALSAARDAASQPLPSAAA